MGFFKYLISGTFVCLLLAVACRNEEITTDKGAGIAFSTDTVFFDTILTSFGSVTKRFKIYNPNNQDIVIRDIYLGGGNSSYYKLNIDGTSGNSQKNIKIAGKDSIYVFAEVTIDPLGSNTPLVVNDSVICVTNGNIQTVRLVAFGQDVNLFRSRIIKTQTWTARKPYLIYNNAAVDSNELLTIEAGTVVYFNNNSSLLVWGRLETKGTLENPVIFTGDRFDRGYSQTAGQWGTIYFDPKSTGNLLEYTIIKNAIAGIQAGYPVEGPEPTLELRNCMILNSASVGIYAFGANIHAYNTVIADCGQFALLLLMGGEYNFYHCTISNISAYAPGVFSGQGYKSRRDPSTLAANFTNGQELDKYFNIKNVTYHNELKALNFYNSILYGVLDKEIEFHNDTLTAFNYMFDHCLIKNNKDSLDYSNAGHFSSIILNRDPGFMNDSISKGPFNFQLKAQSPAIDSGSIELIQGIPQAQYDFMGRSRTADGKPDIGAYEHYE